MRTHEYGYLVPESFGDLVGEIPASAPIPVIIQLMVDEIARLRDRVAALEGL